MLSYNQMLRLTSPIRRFFWKLNQLWGIIQMHHEQKKRGK